MLRVSGCQALLRASCFLPTLLRFILAEAEDDGLSSSDAWGLRLSLDEDHETCPDADGDCSLSLRQLRAQQSIATAAEQQDLKEDSRSEEERWGLSSPRLGLSHDGRNLGTSCMFHNCAASRGETVCHHFRCLCKESYIAAGGRCVPKADAPTQALDTRTQTSCGMVGYCDASLGPAACFDSHCFCIKGYAFQNGRCVELSQTSTTTTETVGDSAWIRFGLSHDARFNGGTCLIHNCDKTRGPQLCHHFRCICKRGYIAAGGACVKRDLLPTQALSTRTGKSCTVSGYCGPSVGPASCVDNQCFCIQGFEAQGGICVQSAGAAENSNTETQTTTTEFTTTTTLPMEPVSTDPEPEAAWDDDDCENAQPTSKCGKTAAWAKSDGIYSNPEWYPGVKPSDPVAKFQSALYEAGQGGCTKRPCIGGLPINVSKPHGMKTRTTRRIPPPKTPFEHNGIEWTKLTVKGKTAHVFAVGDWGGLAGTLPHDHKIVQYVGGHTQGPHTMGRYRVDPLTHFSTCSTPQMSDCFSAWGKPCSGGESEKDKCCEKSCGWLEEVDTKAQSLVAEQMRKRALTSPPDYILNVGDNFYWGGVEGKCGQTPMSKVNSITATQFAWIFENVYSGPGLNGKPWLGVFGNHDWGGREFDAAWDQQIAYTWTSDRWVIPAPYWMQKVEYVDQGFTVDIFMTDSNVEDALEDVDESPEHNICGRAHNPEGASCAAVGGPASIHDCHGWFKKLWDEGAEWVTKKLKDSTADWQFLVTHFPCGHNPDFYRDLHLKYGLDLMITGHVHFQKLYWSPEKLGGLTCFITGGGGGITSENAVDLESEDDHQYGFFHLQLSKESVGIESINWRGNTVQKAVAEPFVGVETAKADLVPCEKPAAGSKCDQTVKWAKNDGIHSNPDWFSGLTPASSYEEFQNKFYKEHKHGCGKPCLPR